MNGKTTTATRAKNATMAQRTAESRALAAQEVGKSRGQRIREPHVRHRDYSPPLGRFIERDSIGFEAGDNNWYRFVANGPSGKTDPKGFCEITGSPAGGRPALQGMALTLSLGPSTQCAATVVVSGPSGQITAAACPTKAAKPDCKKLKPNGCTVIGPGKWDFTGPCNEHDRCYARSGTTKKLCDDEFAKDLHRLCNSKYRHVPTARFDCHTDASAYWLGVWRFGSKAFYETRMLAATCGWPFG
jgi:RHS repeat-associated protein